MHLRLKKGGKEDIHLGVIFGLGKGRDFEGSKGDFIVVFGEGVGVHVAIMHDSSIKEPRAPKRI